MKKVIAPHICMEPHITTCKRTSLQRAYLEVKCDLGKCILQAMFFLKHKEYNFVVYDRKAIDCG